MKLRTRGISGTRNQAESERERAHRVIARKAAAEGIVLLENNGVLPLKKGSNVALYGGGARHTIKGGTGSGSVNNRSNVSIDEGLRNAGFTVTTDTWLDAYDAAYGQSYKEWKDYIYEISEPGNFDSLYRAHASHPMQMPKGSAITKTEAADAIYVISRISGEGADRKAEPGDYYLSEQEEEELKAITECYDNTIVILNVGGVMDVSFLEKYNIAALVMLSQAGMEGGNALADVLSGAVTPSGKLTDTWGCRYEDYPSSATFSHNNGNIIEEKYYEGIYVGYRYFDSFEVEPRYPFGYGMSYTTFDVTTEKAAWEPDAESKTITVTVKVTNTGSCAGKEVVQVYTACPFGKLKKERKRLVVFGKTALLQPGESETLHLKVPTVLLESYRTGKAVYCMEAGDYDFLVGTSSRDVTLAARLTLDKTVETEHLTNICPLLDALKEIQPEEEKEERWRAEREQMWEEKKAEIPLLFLDEKGLIRDGKSAEEMYKILKFGETNAAEAKECDANGCEFEAETTEAKEDAENCKCGAEQPKWEERRRRAMEKAAELAQKLTPEEKTALVCGRSSGSKEIIGAAAVTVPGAAGETTASLLEKYGVANVILADGPAGIRITSHYQKNPSDGSVYKMNMYQRLENRIFGTEFLHDDGEDYYQYCSAIPVGTLLAQTFDTELLEEVGRMIGAELEEFGVTLWLAPGMNIHRNPLCGRNFEYYSEDPLVSGKMAAALTRGVQSRYGVGTTIKHYACNNQEENRRGVSSIVSERALREIYLKGFEIAIKESQPKAIMTSYNKVNGVHTANSYDLCTTAARKEWGFAGIIMTDWTTTNADGGSSAAKCIAAGNDLVMPGTDTDRREILDALSAENDQYLEEKDLTACAQRILEMIFTSNSYE